MSNDDSIVQVWGGPSPDKTNLARPKWGMDFRRAPEPASIWDQMIPTDEHINDYRARYGLPPYPTKAEE